jgi:hypothetical protein
VQRLHCSNGTVSLSQWVTNFQRILDCVGPGESWYGSAYLCSVVLSGHYFVKPKYLDLVGSTVMVCRSVFPPFCVCDSPHLLSLFVKQYRIASTVFLTIPILTRFSNRTNQRRASLASTVCGFRKRACFVRMSALSLCLQYCLRRSRAAFTYRPTVPSRIISRPACPDLSRISNFWYAGDGYSGRLLLQYAEIHTHRSACRCAS